MTPITHSRPTLGADDLDAVRRSLESGLIAQGGLTAAFEGAVAERLGMPRGLAAASGTDALIAALLAVGVKPGGEVVMPTYVCEAVSAAIHAVGATPVLCDVEVDRCVSRTTVEPHLTGRTAAIVVVHTFGAVADVAGIAALGVPVVEDCCQAFGARSAAGAAGVIGDACVLSFHATKLLTTGEGGMALSARPGVAARLDEFRRDSESLAPRRIAPMADLQAALGLSQLAKYDGFLQRRRLLADRYFAALAGVNGVELPHDIRARSVFFRFAVRSATPFPTLAAAFANEGVIVRRGVDRLIHQLTETPGSFPTAEQLFAETVSLPLYPSLTDAAADQVAAVARRVFGAS